MDLTIALTRKGSTQMSLNDIIISIKVVTDLASFIQKAGDSWYRSSVALEKFKINVAELQRNCESWQRRAERYGLSSERTFMESMSEATTLLEKEKAKLVHLERRHGRWCLFGCLFAICGLDFPSELGASIQKLLDDTIPNRWKAEEIGDAAAEGKVKISARRQAFGFRRDRRYVRLPAVEQEIREALAFKAAANESMRVVLLDGPAGIGKSCMARHLALDYREASIDNSSSRTFAGTLVPESSTSRVGDVYSTSFDHVLYVECGEKIDSSAKQVELLKLLGWEEAPEPQDLNSPERAKYIEGILKQLLKESKVLIILDDVWHEDFLDNLASLCGNSIRILATTQRSRLCDDSLIEELESISMDRITAEDAQQILQVHAGFAPDDDIADPIQECMMDLISKVSTNPHALACVATAIDRRRPAQLSEWENAIIEHEKLLSDASTPILKIHGIPYSSTIGMKFARLNEEERKLMVLMTLLDGPSVLETVVQLLNTGIMVQKDTKSHRSCITFSNCRKHLEDLQCVKVSEFDGQLSWSIHFLDRKFVQETMADDMHSLLQNFVSLPMAIQGLGKEPQDHFVKLLGALYFRNELAKAIILTFSFPMRERKFNVATRNAVQSIVYLMMKNVYKDWTLQERSSADQMFLSYITHGMIHEAAVGILLRSSISEQIRLSVMLDIVKVSDIWLSEEAVMSLLCVFGELRVVEQNKNAFDLNMQHCQIVCSLAKAGGEFTDRHLVRFSICKMTKILLGLVEIVGNVDKQNDIQIQCINAFGWLGCEESQPDQDRVALLVETPMLLNKLINILEDDTCSALQAISAQVLGRFAIFSRIYSGVARKIFDTGGQQLIRSCAQTTNKTLQENAMYTVRHLAYISRDVSLEIFNSPFAMNSLLNIIGSDDGDHVKGLAAFVLNKIITRVWPSPEANTGIIQRVSECLAGLFAERRDVPEQLEESAANALTLIDPARGKGLQLISPSAFRLRGRLLVRLGHYQDGLSDLKKAARLLDGKCYHTFRNLAHVKALLKDWEGALKDANRAVELVNDSVQASIHSRQYILQERGVLKRMMGDLSGALADLDESLNLTPDDYEALKHRAYVKFCMGDVDGALKDAEAATPLRPRQYDRPGLENNCLGTSIVEFLTFRL